MRSIGPRKFPLENASIVEAKAAKTYSKAGESIAGGRKVKRLNFGDARFNIAVFIASTNPVLGTIQHIFLRLRHVQLKVGDQKIYVNVNSLAERLHLSKSDILAADAMGKLDQLIDQKAEHMTSILDGYKDIFTLFQDSNEMQGKVGINAESLMKIVSVAVPKLFSTNQEVFIEENEDEEFIAEFDDQKKNLRLTFIEEELGGGTFGTVFQVVTLSSEGQRVGAFKLANEDSALPQERIELARKDVKNEYDMLVWLWSDPNSPAPSSIQAKPHKYISIAPSSYGENEVGYRGEIYDGDLEKAFQESIGEKMKRGLSMMEGVAYLHQRGLVHKDLKPANFLIKGNATVVSDLGGARKLESYSQMKAFNLGVHTKSYTSTAAIKRAMANFGKDQKVFEENMKQNDAFSTAVSIYKLFTGQLPYSQQIANGYYIPEPLNDQQKEDLNKQGVPEDIINLLDEMINGPIPTMSEAYERYKAALLRA